MRLRSKQGGLGSHRYSAPGFDTDTDCDPDYEEDIVTGGKLPCPGNAMRRLVSVMSACYSVLPGNIGIGIGIERLLLLVVSRTPNKKQIGIL